MKAIKESMICDFSNALVIDNFRLDDSGALLKREGYSAAADLGYTIRGALSDDRTTYIVAGKRFYVITDGECEYIGELTSCKFANDDEKVSLFIDLGIVYMIGGASYYSYDPESGVLSEVIGYVPTIRRNATNTSTGEAYEPQNLITSRVKMDFLTESCTGYTLPLWGTVTQVVAVYAGTRKISTSSYTAYITDGSASVTIRTTSLFQNYPVLTIEYELDTTSHPIKRSEYLSNCKVHVHNNDSCKCLFLYGGGRGSKVCYSEYGYNGTDTKEPQLDYFLDSAYFTVGDGSKEVRSMAALGKRTVIMTKNMIYELIGAHPGLDGVSTARSFSTTLITPEMGIAACSDILLYDDELYFFSDNGLYRYAYNAETFEYYAINIAFAEHTAIKRDMYDTVSLFLLRKNSEIWCCYDGGAMIYNLRFKRWYGFTGFSAGGMVLHCDNAAFYTGNRFYRFSEDSYTDDGVAFEAVFESTPIDLGALFTKKTVFGFGAAFDRYSGVKLDFTLKNDSAVSFEGSFEPEDIDAPSPCVMRTHARLGSSHHVTCRLVSPVGSAPANIRGIMIRYRELGGA